DDQFGGGIGVDAMGNVFVTGSMTDTVTFAGKPLASEGATDMFVIKYGAGGNEICGARYGDAMDQTGAGLAVLSTGDVVVAGNHHGTVDLGCMMTATSKDLNDALVTKFTPTP